jgi:aspartyl-tRNA(Asn)/glutamyl-tRNA(Gln) amidotransferase subunit A
LTRSVEDAAIMLQVLAGYDPADATSLRVPVDDYHAALTGDIRRLRVGIPRAYFYERLDDAVRAAVEQALDVLRGLGAELHDVEIPGLQGFMPGALGVVLAEAQAYHAEALAQRPGDFGADVSAILSQPGPSTAEFVAGRRAMYGMTEAMRGALEEVDVLVTPTTPVPATRIGQETVEYGGAEDPVLVAMIRCTWPFNATRLPALSIPCGFTADGLPIGLQLAGRPLDEATVLRAGHAYEQVAGMFRIPSAEFHGATSEPL